MFQAAPGDFLVLYSDGITDHLNAEGLEYGRRRLADVVRAGCRRSASEVVEAILDDLDRWSTTAFDDQTVFAMKVR